MRRMARLPPNRFILGAPGARRPAGAPDAAAGRRRRGVDVRGAAALRGAHTRLSKFYMFFLPEY